MARMKSSLSVRVNRLISEARGKCANPNSGPELVHAMMGPGFRKKLRADKEADDFIMACGWADACRAYLKGVPNGEQEEEGMSRKQADFWPDTTRQLVLDINRARVYVPSRMEYVPLMPGTIQRDEVKEAGQYLLKKGAECVRVGNALMSLHNAWQPVDNIEPHQHVVVQEHVTQPHAAR